MNRRWIPASLATASMLLVSALVFALPAKDQPQIAISLSIPIKETWEPNPVRKVQLQKDDPTGKPDFHVVITNVSDHPIHLWQEWCSWGHSNLSFVFVGIDGELVPCAKRPRAWTRNHADDCLIEPREHLVLDVFFSSESWQEPDFQRMKPAKDGTIAMRAVYETLADDETAKHGVWTGKVVSKEHRVLLGQ